MSEEEILYKLGQYFKENHTINKEDQVVYLFMAFRKLLDRKRDRGHNSQYPILRFYCDWCVHISKNKITPEIKTIMDRIDAGIPKAGSPWLMPNSQEENISFIYMEHLRREMNAFLKDCGLQTDITTNDAKWLEIVKTLAKILADQPIMNPTSNIKQFSFSPAAEGSVIWLIIFNDERGVMKFGNFY